MMIPIGPDLPTLVNHQRLEGPYQRTALPSRAVLPLSCQLNLAHEAQGDEWWPLTIASPSAHSGYCLCQEEGTGFVCLSVHLCLSVLLEDKLLMVNLPDLVRINHDTFYSARCCFPGLAGPEQIGDNVPVW